MAYAKLLLDSSDELDDWTMLDKLIPYSGTICEKSLLDFGVTSEELDRFPSLDELEVFASPPVGAVTSEPQLAQKNPVSDKANFFQCL
jgi:hypothetical protein